MRTKRQEKAAKKQQALETLRVRQASSFHDTVILESSSSCSSPSVTASDTEEEINIAQPSTSKQEPPRKKKKLLNDNLVASLDVAKISDRSASLILIPTISNLGENPEDYNVSYSTIRRARQKGRKGKSERISENF